MPKFNPLSCYQSLVFKSNCGCVFSPPFHFCPDERSRPNLPALDVCVTSDDKRYFVSETDDITNLEASVLESPEDTQLWIKLAFKYLGQNET